MSTTRRTIALMQVQCRWNATPCKYAKQAKGGQRLLCSGWKDFCVVNEEYKDVLAIEKGYVDNGRKVHSVQTNSSLVLCMQTNSTV